ncbi:hypothetical protein PUMCH_000457 [Australozyma saopauloensis]|uniref:Prefoldin subunit 1 n=1 Tax=Australozyma saopauloensis TaxID=291208 RepID=A0AAX4H3W4_9ASCO|nr:hypothetical protein PUMCH_000457 [[Candida] saopauloensis]
MVVEVLFFSGPVPYDSPDTSNQYYQYYPSSRAVRFRNQHSLNSNTYTVKMSLDPQALQKLLLEMDSQLNKSRAELSMCNVQLNRVETNISIVENTSSKLKELTKPEDSVWKGVGRAFLKTDTTQYLDQINKDKKEFLETQKGLKTKQHYLETTLENTIKSMTDIVGRK